MHTIPPLLAALGGIGIRAVSVKMARTPSHADWLTRSAMLSLGGRRSTVDTNRSGATGRTTGGGVLAWPINDVVTLG